MGALLSLVSGTLAFIELSASGLPSILKWVGGRTRHGVSRRNYDMAKQKRTAVARLLAAYALASGLRRFFPLVVKIVQPRGELGG